MGKLFGAIWYYATFQFLWSAQGIKEAADRKFTSSAQGVGRAFDLHQETLVDQYNEMRDAVSQVEVVLEADRGRLSDLNKEEEEQIRRRDGALLKYEEAEAAGDKAAAEKHKAAFERYDARIQQIEALQADIEGRVKVNEGQMSGFFAQLTKMQGEIQNLPSEKAAAIAEFVSSQKIVELNDRLNGLKKSIDRGPIDAVLKNNRELSAKARISQKLSGADVNRQDDEYESAGRASASSDRMAQMLAARKAERSAKTGEQPVQQGEADRPRI